MPPVSPLPPAWLLFALAGMLSGSFLNVLIYRLPRMAERKMLQGAGVPRDAWPGGAGPYNLFLPGSRCPACGHPIPAHRNIPLLSWLLLRGRAACCGASIPLRYFLVELLCLCLALAAWLRYGNGSTAAAAFLALALLLALGTMAQQLQSAPASLLYLLLWSGLLVNSSGLFVSAGQGVWAAAAPLALLVLPAARTRQRKECILLAAALSAWLGWPGLLVSAAVTVLSRYVLRRCSLPPLTLLAAGGTLLFLLPYFAM